MSCDIMCSGHSYELHVSHMGGDQGREIMFRVSAHTYTRTHTDSHAYTQTHTHTHTHTPTHFRVFFYSRFQS